MEELNLIEERKKLIEKPYYYITEEWAENVLMNVGKRAFSILCLMPGSLILPDIPFGSKSIMPKINNLLVGSPGIGKCLKKGTLILMSDGTYKKIEDVLPNDYIFSMSNEMKFGKFKVMLNINNGIKPLYRIKTRFGKEIEITENHPLYTIFGWKELKELYIGDYIATPRSVNIVPSSNMSDSLIKILAYLIADGSLTDRKIVFTKENKDMLDEFECSLYEISNNLKVKKFKKKGTNALDYQVSSKIFVRKKGVNYVARERNDLCLILDKLGLYGKNSHSKFIPNEVLKLDDSKIALFLNRLFSCDGCIEFHNKIYKISYSSCSKILINQIRDLLLRKGIQSSIRFRKTKCNGKYFDSYELSLINLEDCKKFIHWVGFLKGKEDRSLKILNLRDQKQFYRDIFPKEIFNLIQKKDNIYIKGIKKDQSISRNNLGKIDSYTAKLYLNSDILWDSIKSIEKIEESEVYDLSIEGNNNFIANGFVVHNSSIADKFEKITYFPLKRRDISAPELQQKAVSMEMLTLIIEDFSQFSEDYDKVKIAEGILGEEASVGKSNMRVELLDSVRAIGLLEGTPTDLERYGKQLEGGLLSRCIFSLITLTPQEHSEIGDYINLKAGDKNFSNNLKIKEEAVINFYKELKAIQSGNHEISPIVEYNIEMKFKEEAGKKWKELSERLIRDLGEKSYIRDLNYYYKFLVSSAFLNIFNRRLQKIEIGRDKESGKILYGNILYPNEEDHKLALKLMVQNMKNKWALDKAMFYKKNIRTFEMFKNILQNEKTSEVKNILLNISPYARFLKDNPF